MKKYIQNITGESELFPDKQVLAYTEKDKGNIGEAMKKLPSLQGSYAESYKRNPAYYKDYVLIFPGEMIETDLNGENIASEPRFKLVIKDETKTGED